MNGNFKRENNFFSYFKWKSPKKKVNKKKYEFFINIVHCVSIDLSFFSLVLLKIIKQSFHNSMMVIPLNGTHANDDELIQRSQSEFS